MPQNDSDVNCENGLCSTCNNATGCELCVERTIPVWDCSEYDGTSPAPVISSPPENFKMELYESRDREESSRFKGLCIDCENRTTCTSPKPEGGIWHCENYR